MKNKFYTYIYLDSRRPVNYSYDAYYFNYEPFYVGKGCGNRWRHHLKTNIKWCNYHLRNRIIAIRKNNLEPIVLKIEENLTNNQASKLEIKIIKFFGRRDLNTGILVNMTDGGDGSSERIVSEMTRKKIMKGKGKSRNVGINNQSWGKYRTKYLITFPDSEQKIIYGIKKFCRENNLSLSKVCQVNRGKRKHHKGFKCKQLQLISNKESFINKEYWGCPIS